MSLTNVLFSFNSFASFKERLNKIPLECKLVNDLTNNNLMTDDDGIILILKNMFKNKEGVPLLFILNRINGSGHVVWAIKIGDLPIIICRQQANNGNCPIISEYNNILGYLKYNNIVTLNYISNILSCQI